MTVAEKTDVLWIRAGMIQAIRLFFIKQGYLEVETPNLIPAPAPETHIDAIACGDLFLHTSPELCMKRLVAAGYGRIFQIGKCYRAGERGANHLPEFTMLEWYHRGIDYFGLMDECEEMIRFVSAQTGRGNLIRYRDCAVDLKIPWERLTVNDAFDRYAPVSMQQALKDNSFDEIMAFNIEPRLGQDRPSFLYDYPAIHAALARKKPGNPDLAERVELYMAGMELANGFSELNDPDEQHRRFVEAMQERRGMGRTVYPVAEKFLEAVGHMPASAGIALGIDRLVMLFTGASSIDEVVTFTPENL
jgi:elongation factor P--(R)-beta-lysine ligase